MSNRDTIPKLLSILSALAEELKDAHAQLAAGKQPAPGRVADESEVADLRRRLRTVEVLLDFERNLTRDLSSAVDGKGAEVNKLKEDLQDKDYQLDGALGEVEHLRGQVKELQDRLNDRDKRLNQIKEILISATYPRYAIECICEVFKNL